MIVDKVFREIDPGGIEQVGESRAGPLQFAVQGPSVGAQATGDMVDRAAARREEELDQLADAVDDVRGSARVFPKSRSAERITMPSTPWPKLIPAPKTLVCVDVSEGAQ